MNDFQKRIAAASLSGFIGAIAVLSILVGFGVLDLPAFLKRKIEVADTKPASRTAFDIALAHAKAWQPDALLAFMNSDAAEQGGVMHAWKIGFVSQSRPDVAYIVHVREGRIEGTTEVAYRGAGAEFPNDITSEEDAIREMRALAGYEDAPVLGVEAVYGPSGKVWYWGIRTPKGVVSVETRKR